MSNDEMQNDLVEDVSETEELTTEELVEDEQVQDEEIVEASDDAEDEDEDEEEEVEESADEEDDEDEEPVVEMPKTKAAIMASVNDMLKKSKKEGAQKIYAQVYKVINAPDVEAPKVAKEDVDVDVSHIDYQEDLDSLVAEEATLSDGFQAKAGIIFEAALKSKVSAEIERLESEYVQNLEEEVTEIKSELVEKVDSYLNYVVGNWMEENKVAVETGLRTEIAEDFMASLQSVFKEHYIEIPEGKVDLVDELAEQVAELEESLNKSIEENIALTESVSGLVIP